MRGQTTRAAGSAAFWTHRYAVIGAALLLSFSAAAFGATLTSDASDYAPGDPATLTGAGFQPLEEVVIQVLHVDETGNEGENHDTWTVTADELGGFVTIWTVCTDDCIGSTLEARAVGTLSLLEASVIFTDSPRVDSVDVGDQEQSSPGQQCAGASFTFTVTVFRGQNQGHFTADITCSGLPAGAACVPVSVSLAGAPDADASATTTVTVTTDGTTPGGTFGFTVTATATVGGGNDFADDDASLTVLGSGSVCGGSDTACDALDTCGDAGACVDNVDPAGSVCLTGTSECDPDDVCDGSTTTCAPLLAPEFTPCGSQDDIACDAPNSCDDAGSCIERVDPAGSVCLTGSGPCDPDDTCDGSTTACAPLYADEFTPCGSPDDTACDAPDSCNATGSCVERVDPAGSVCLTGSGACDPDDTCDGSTTACAPVYADEFTPCGSPDDTACDGPDSCNATGSCIERVDPAGSVCQPGTGTCDPDDLCDGSTTACAPVYADEFTPCGSPDDTACDAPDSCNATGSCIERVDPAGSVCQPGTGTCDPDDLCDGSTTACAPVYADEFTPCGSPDDTACDAPDSCNATG